MKEATGQDIPLYEILGRLAEKGMDASSSSMKVQTTFDGTRTDSGSVGKSEIFHQIILHRNS